MDKLNFDLVIKRSIHGVFALISRTFFLNLISFAAFFIITGILQPNEIGIYTIVVSIQRVISFLTDFGFGAALIQKREELKQEDITTFFSIQAGVTLIVFLFVFVFIGPITDFFKLSEQGTRLLLVLVFTIFLSSFKTIPSILLERSINFSKLVFPQIIESLVFNFILIVLAVRGYSIDSFSWAFLLSSIVGIPFYYLVSPWKLRLGVDKSSLRSLKYGIQFQAKNILATVKDDLLTVILVRFLTFTEIGYIGFAQRLAFFVFRYVVDSVTKVTFSAYSRAQKDLSFLKKAVEKSLFFVSASMFPILSGLIIVSPYLIRFNPNWRNKWEPALFSVAFFCLNAAVSSLSGILVNVLDATGKVKISLRLMVMWTFLIWIFTPALIFLYGYNGVSIASFLVTLTIVYTVYLVKQIINFNFFQSIYKSMISTIFMTIVVFIMSRVLVNSILSLVFVILIGIVVYVISLFILAHKELIGDIKRFGVRI